MDVHAPKAGGFAEVPLSPGAFVLERARYLVVPGDAGPWGPTSLLQLSSNTIEVGVLFDGHLDIDHVLRCESGYRGRTDMVDARRTAVQGHPKAARHVAKSVRPTLIVFSDLDDAHRPLLYRRARAAKRPSKDEPLDRRGAPCQSADEVPRRPRGRPAWARDASHEFSNVYDASANDQTRSNTSAMGEHAFVCPDTVD